MSYDFHIVRSKDSPITNDEWNAFVASEPGEWKIEKELSATNPTDDGSDQTPKEGRNAVYRLARKPCALASRRLV